MITQIKYIVDKDDYARSDTITVGAYINGKDIGHLIYGEEFDPDYLAEEYPKIESEIYNAGKIYTLQTLTINMSNRGQGIASGLMKEFLKSLPEHTLVLLNACPIYDDKSLNLKELVLFYKKFGFTVLKTELKNIEMYMVI